jgi:hypothetical protein
MLVTPEDPETQIESDKGTGKRSGDRPCRRQLTIVDAQSKTIERIDNRIDLEEELVLGGNVNIINGIDNRRQIKPDLQYDLQHMRDVAIVDVDGGKEKRSTQGQYR